MNVVDSSGWLEYYIDDINAGFFAPAIEDVSMLIVPTISIYEIFKRTLAEKGQDHYKMTYCNTNCATPCYYKNSHNLCTINNNAGN